MGEVDIYTRSGYVFMIPLRMAMFCSLLEPTPSNATIRSSSTALEDRSGPKVAGVVERRGRCEWRTALLATACCLSGCIASNPPGPDTGGPQPPLRIGPEWVVLDRPVREAAGAQAPDGTVHLMALARDTDELYHVVVGRNGAESEEVVLTTKGSIAPAFAIGAALPLVSLAAGFDNDGTLRVSVDGRHMAWRDGRWSAPEPGPRCEQMVRAGRVLHCAYRENGSKLAPGMRIDWVISPLLFLPVPIPVRNTKLLLACRSALGWKPWAILEPAEQRDVRRFRIAGDDSGSVQVAYAVGWTQGLGFLLLSARAPALGSCDEVQPDLPIAGIPGIFPGIFMDHDWSGRVDIATDPTSGRALIVAIHQYAAVGFLHSPDSISAQGEAAWRRDPWREDFWEVRLAPAAGGRFHALFATNVAWSYAQHAENTWSRPVPLLAYSRFVRDSTLLISNASNRALITWIAGDGRRMLAKWIEAAP